jgi:hypothetical protein
MDEQQRAALRMRGQEFLREFVTLAGDSRDLVEALFRVLEPTARVHLQNGDTVSPEVAFKQVPGGARLFPELEIEFDEAIFPDDRLMVRVRMIAAGGRALSNGAFMARITPELTVGELWPYINPGFALAFPARGIHLTPPVADAGGEAEARGLYDSWVRSAEAGEDFVRSMAQSLAPGGVVHLGNGDCTDGAGLDELFARIAAGLYDLAIEIEDVMFDGAFVNAPFRMSGMHQGQIGWLAPSGRRLPSTGALLARADRNGRASEVWVYLAPGYAATFPPGRRYGLALSG